MRLPLFQIDAFAERVFQGNPAAVCPLEAWLPEALMQAIAAENNLSETAFCVPEGEGYGLRWFTPLKEVDLCGHATLASAFVIFHHLGQPGERITFDSRSGPLHVARRADGLLELDFPARPAQPVAAADLPPALLHSVDRQPTAWLKVATHPYYLAVYPSQADVLAVRPDFARLAALGDTRLIVTAPGEGCDCASRFFAPGAGVPEDPVTGSAHCTIVPYWAARLGRTELHARQVSRRGGELFCTLAGDRVRLAGRSRLYLEGNLHL